MSLSANDNNTSTSILSIKEIIAIIIVFSFLLYLLFPKNDIDEIIESKGKNANLSINYIESMILYYPDNIKLKMLLLKKYDSSGKIKKALKLIDELLKKTKDKKILDELYLTQYNLLKELYFKKEGNITIDLIKDKLYHYFKFKEKNRDYMFFLGEATQMDFKKLKYISLKGLMKQNPKMADFDLTKQAYYLSSSLGYKDEANQYLFRLIEFKDANSTLKDSVLSSLLNNKKYQKAIELSKKLFLEAKDKEKVENYFNIALYATALLDKENNSTDSIKKLINSYDSSREMRAYDISYILDNLLKTGYLKEASRFAEESFKKYSKEYDENATKLAIDSLVYNQELKPALKIALFAEKKFNNPKWLDKSITLSVWQGKMQDAVVLNEKGLKKYRAKKYEKYLKEKTNLNSAYRALGEIYKKNGNIDKIIEYYNYIGKPQEAELYFQNLYKKRKSREILKALINFSYRNRNFNKTLTLYRSYKNRYGIDKILEQNVINSLTAQGRYKKAYRMLQELEKLEKHDAKLKELLKKLQLEEGFNLYKQLIDLGWIFKDYKYLYKILWQEDRYDELEYDNYDKLIMLDREMNGGKRLPYLYNRLYKKTKKEVYLKELLSIYSSKEQYKKFKSLYDRLSPKLKRELKRDINFNLTLANYYISISKPKKALNIFKTLLNKYPKNSDIHQSYLWFIIDNKRTKLLKKELQLLKRNSTLQKRVGFPSVVSALMLQKTDLALKWLRPLLKNSDSLEYKVVYSDILQLQDRVEGAKKVRLKLFKKLNRMIKKSPKLLKDKPFARVYLRLISIYGSPREKRRYFKKLKLLFKKKDFMEMKIGWKSYIKSSDKVKYLKEKYHMDLQWLNLYLAMSRGDNTLKQKLLKDDKDILAFRDRVTASNDIGDIAGAYTLAFKGMEDNSRDVDLYKIYKDMITKEYPKGKAKIEYKQISKDILAIESKIEHRWHLYRGLEGKIFFNQYRYMKDNYKDYIDNSLGVSILNSGREFIWSFELEKYLNKQKRDISSDTKIKYKKNSSEFNIEIKQNSRAKRTTKLRMLGIQDSVEIEVKQHISNRLAIGASYRDSRYKIKGEKFKGNLKKLRFNGAYIIKTGYPDIKIDTYLLISRFRDVKENAKLKRRKEFGSRISIGESGKNSIHRDLRPYGSFGLSIDNRSKIGSSLSLGLSGELMGEDILNLSFDYSQGVDLITYPYYGVNLEYKF